MTTQSTAGWAEDVFGYDDYHVVAGEPSLAAPVAGVPYLVSEAVGTILPTFRWFDPPAVLAGQAYAHALVHDQAGSDPGYAGLIAWCGFDYYSGPPPASDAWGRIRNWRGMKTPGVADVFRVPKPGAAVYRAQADPAARQVIVPAFFWDDRDAAGCRGHVRHQLRPPGDLPGRRAPRDRHAGGGDVRQPRSPARVRRPQRSPGAPCPTCE